jgi:hypothetical protein
LILLIQPEEAHHSPRLFFKRGVLTSYAKPKEKKSEQMNNVQSTDRKLRKGLKVNEKRKRRRMKKDKI